ncbi:Hypothetical protein NTJ_10645 [Nesidiocoris tenuis]|uniref:Uncharacterized protein n=1 Tax=Nesidiocoris tenuis TaxID=355587 RepID=A0ABN7B3U7_9HEMI|nr:Hypothetical protein NTJ_10645 [Nesidiocoris tenuis]
MPPPRIYTDSPAHGRLHKGTPPPASMQQVTFMAAFLLLVIVCSAHASPFTGDRDFDVPFRKKPLRRGGCSAFGHSCFGGHGKRSDSSSIGPQLRLSQTNLQHRLLNPDFFRQWLEANRGTAPLLQGQ